MRQHGGFWHFSRVGERLVRCAKIAFLLGAGGMCILFLKSVRKGCFRKVFQPKAKFLSHPCCLYPKPPTTSKIHEQSQSKEESF